MEAMYLEKCIVTWIKNKSVEICVITGDRETKQSGKNKNQAESVSLSQKDMQCKGAKHRLGEQQQQKKKDMVMMMVVEKEDIKLTPLWIFPNTVSYCTPFLSIKCF